MYHGICWTRTAPEVQVDCIVDLRPSSKAASSSSPHPVPSSQPSGPSPSRQNKAWTSAINVDIPSSQCSSNIKRGRLTHWRYATYQCVCLNRDPLAQGILVYRPSSRELNWEVSLIELHTHILSFYAFVCFCWVLSNVWSPTTLRSCWSFLQSPHEESPDSCHPPVEQVRSVDEEALVWGASPLVQNKHCKMSNIFSKRRLSPQSPQPLQPNVPPSSWVIFSVLAQAYI